MTDWRQIERQLVDCLQHMGAKLQDVCGRPFVVDNFYDGVTGELLTCHYVVDIQEWPNC
jgi:hypothetical protein